MNEHPELTPEESRQARKVPMMRRILMISLIAAVVLLLGLAFFLTP
jgi:hypothetical protein